jgi:hypothetical protein
LLHKAFARKQLATLTAAAAARLAAAFAQPQQLPGVPVSQSGLLHGGPFTSVHKLPTSGNRGHQVHLSPLSNKGATRNPSLLQ